MYRKLGKYGDGKESNKIKFESDKAKDVNLGAGLYATFYVPNGFKIGEDSKNISIETNKDNSFSLGTGMLNKGRESEDGEQLGVVEEEEDTEEDTEENYLKEDIFYFFDTNETGGNQSDNSGKVSDKIKKPVLTCNGRDEYNNDKDSFGNTIGDPESDNLPHVVVDTEHAEALAEELSSDGPRKRKEKKEVRSYFRFKLVSDSTEKIPLIYLKNQIGHGGGLDNPIKKGEIITFNRDNNYHIYSPVMAYYNTTKGISYEVIPEYSIQSLHGWNGDAGDSRDGWDRDCGRKYVRLIRNILSEGLESTRHYGHKFNIKYSYDFSDGGVGILPSIINPYKSGSSGNFYLQKYDKDENFSFKTINNFDDGEVFTLVHPEDIQINGEPTDTYSNRFINIGELDSEEPIYLYSEKYKFYLSINNLDQKFNSFKSIPTSDEELSSLKTKSELKMYFVRVEEQIKIPDKICYRTEPLQTADLSVTKVESENCNISDFRMSEDNISYTESTGYNFCIPKNKTSTTLRKTINKNRIQDRKNEYGLNDLYISDTFAYTPLPLPLL